jgi:hypothetical protein
MRFAFSSTAIGLALAAAAVTAAHAQTVITPDPVVTVPAATVMAPATETVQTTETVRTIRPLRSPVHRVVTTRTVTWRIVPGRFTTRLRRPRWQLQRRLLRARP